jgi:predicted Rossmann fold nucleotide-binding protein DprA/Smf involved in DNA uptake
MRLLEEAEAPPAAPLGPYQVGQTALLGFLDQEPAHIDDIRRRSSLPITEVSSLLTMLELQGLVKQVGCMHYVRVREVNPTYGK